MGLIQQLWSPPLQSLFLGKPPALEIHLLPQLVLLSQRFPILPLFPQASGRGSLEVLCPRGENREQGDCLWPTSHPLFILQPPVGLAHRPHTCTISQVPREHGHSHSELSPLPGKTKTLSPNLPPSMLGTGPAPFYVFNKFPNMLISAAAFVVIISLGSWPQNTLFMVD